MAIEIDYEAWEKWQQGKLHEDENVDKHMKSTPYYFAIHGTTWRAKDADLAAVIYYVGNKEPAIVYELLAEAATAPISKLLKIHWNAENKVFIDAFDIDAENAEKLHELLASLPEPMLRNKEFRSDAAHFVYQIQIGSRYGEKIYNWGHDYYTFLQYADTDFNATIAEIMSICASYS
jgi:hypothetical protein